MGRLARRCPAKFAQSTDICQSWGNFEPELQSKARLLWFHSEDFWQMLYDNHQRLLDYVRLAVTDRCNLRCFYCMPPEGIAYLPKSELLSYEEMWRLLRILRQLGIQKLRLTGGEPFMRRDFPHFMAGITPHTGIDQIHLTTNGILTQPYVRQLRAWNVRSVNLSLDTLSPTRFREITRRPHFPKVWATFEALMAAQIPTKINCVVMTGQNTQDLLPLANLTKDYPIEVRFIEEMPFNGTEGNRLPEDWWHHRRILAQLQAAFPSLQALPAQAHATAARYSIEGHQGVVGIIAAFSRTFCGSCNRIRITAQGTLKTCLYDQGVLDIQALLRNNSTDTQIKAALLAAFASRPRDGFEAEAQRAPITESMSTIGG